jgi:hypothetical protein
MNFTVDSEKLQEFNDIIEDSVEFFCDEYMVSGELAWILVQAYAEAKIAQFNGDCV